MRSDSPDMDDAYPKNVPNLILQVQRYLVSHGYGSLRFYTYLKNWHGELRVGTYFVMKEHGRNGEPFALPISLEAFRQFSRMGNSGLWQECMDKRIPIPEAAELYENSVLKKHADFCSEAPAEYLEWFDALLVKCGNEGFPVTEVPGKREYGDDDEAIPCKFENPNQFVFIALPPRFIETIFPYDEDKRWESRRNCQLSEMKDKARWAEWKSKVAAIQQRTKAE